jgi:hypothetical protein
MKASKKIVLAMIATIPFFLPHKLQAEQFYYESPLHEFAPDSQEGSFSLNAESMSCSSGGGTVPSMFAGLNSGRDGYNTRYIGDNSNSSGGHVSGLVGFNIPIGSPGNKGSNCSALLAVVEVEEFLKMLGSLKELGIFDDKKIKKALFTFLESRTDVLGHDLVLALGGSDGSSLGKGQIKRLKKSLSKKK